MQLIRKNIFNFFSSIIGAISIGSIFLIIFLSFFYSDTVLFNDLFSRKIILLTLFCGSIWLFFIKFHIFIKGQKISSSFYSKLFWILFIGLFLIQIWFVSVLKTNLFWDSSKIYDCALANVEGKEFFKGFLDMYPHQMGAAMLTSILLRIFRLFGLHLNQYIYALSYCMIVFTDLSIFILCKSLKFFYKDNHNQQLKASCQILFLSLLNPAIVIWGALYYPTILSLPFLTLGIYFFLYSINNFQNSNDKNTYFIFALGCIFSYVGYHIRATILFLVIAVFLVIILGYINHKYTLKQILISVFIVVSMYICVSFLWSALEHRFYPERDKNQEFPLLNWVMIGVSDDGAFVYEDAEYVASFHTYDEKKEAIMVEIADRLKEKGASGVVQLISKKIYTMWGNGARDMEAFFVQSDRLTNLHEWLVGYKNGPFKIYCQCINVVFWLILLYGITLAFRKGLNERALFLCLIFLANFFFYIVWEVQGHYNLSLEVLKMFSIALASNYILEHIDLSKHIFVKNRGIVYLFTLIIFVCMTFKTYPVLAKNVVFVEHCSIFQQMGKMKISLAGGESIKQEFETDMPFNKIEFKIKNLDNVNNTIDYSIVLRSNLREELWKQEIHGSDIPMQYFVNLSGEQIIPMKNEKFELILSASEGIGEIYLYVYELTLFDAYQNGDLWIEDAFNNQSLQHADLMFRVLDDTFDTIMKKETYWKLWCLLFMAFLFPILWMIYEKYTG